jgi:hypothetical protein
MKEELDTIPVLDGFTRQCECAFCAMQQDADAKMLGFVMSPSYMETDVRDRTNELGFCPTHTERLYAQKNALGLALMLQSHLMKKRQEIDALTAEAPSSGGFLKRKAVSNPIRSYREAHSSSCYLCERVGEIMERYLKAFFYLYRKEASFPETLWNSQGFCLNHFLLLYERCTDFLSGAAAEEFRTKLTALETANLDRVEADLDWFIKKFDYRYREESWKNSKDALPRTILKINGQWVNPS